MSTFVTVLHVFTCILLVLVVLIQSGKGAEISASFGGSSQTVFGSSGGSTFFSRFTAIAATIFFITSMTLTLMGSDHGKGLFSAADTAPAHTSAPAQNAAPAQHAAPTQNTAPVQKPGK
jgi:preprotein translocase subunit SecG